jgi:hypothetical protein
MPALPESRREARSVRKLAAAQSPDLVFFSSVSENIAASSTGSTGPRFVWDC